jgi:hypothetical protein
MSLLTDNYSEQEDYTFLECDVMQFGTYLPHYMGSHPRRL